MNQRGHGRVGDSGFGRRYLQDHVPVRESTAVTGHAVRALYLEAGVVDVAVETGDRELLASSLRRWDDMVATKTALTGGNGSRHSGEAFGDAYELPPDRAYNETCAAIASFQWSWRLLLATGDAKYADLMERVLYNGFGASMSADGQRFFYVNPLQRREDHFEEDDPGRRREWFSCACCPPNIMRLVASLGHYVATVAAMCCTCTCWPAPRSACRWPAASSASTSSPATRGPAEPSSGCGRPRRPSAASRCAIPGWSRELTAALNGEPLAPAVDEHGYLVVRRRWQPGDVLAVNLSVAPRLTYPDGRIDALRDAVAVERGPLVYCFEQADQADDISLADLALSPAGAPETYPSSRRRRAQRAPGGAAGRRCDRSRRGGRRRGRPPPRRPAVLGAPDGPGRRPAAVALPYFQWDNRDGRAMRVWLPRHRPGEQRADRPRPRVRHRFRRKTSSALQRGGLTRCMRGIRGRFPPVNRARARDGWS